MKADDFKGSLLINPTNRLSLIDLNEKLTIKDCDDESGAVLYFLVPCYFLADGFVTVDVLVKEDGNYVLSDAGDVIRELGFNPLERDDLSSRFQDWLKYTCCYCNGKEIRIDVQKGRHFAFDCYVSGGEYRAVPYDTETPLFSLALGFSQRLGILYSLTKFYGWGLVK